MVGKRYKSGTKICVFEKSCWQHREPRAGWLGAGDPARCWCWLGAGAIAAEDTATSVLSTDRGGHVAAVHRFANL